mgnify:CR=1 FL=1
MPKLFSSLSECLGFSQITMSANFIILIALSDISRRLPMGVDTIYKPGRLLVIFLFIFIISCNPVNLTNQIYKEEPTKEEPTEEESIEVENKNERISIKENNIEEKKTNNILSPKKFYKSKVKNNITILFSENSKNKIITQFIKVLELGVYNKNLENVSFEINFFKDKKDLEKIISETKTEGKIYIGPIESEYVEVAKNYCKDGTVFFSFSSNTKLASDCIYLMNFFPKNELEVLFKYLNNNSKIALLYPQNEYGYMVNDLIDNVVNESDAVIINRASYKNDLSNVRSAIKELGKYELRKYELDRQKLILSSKNDEKSKNRLEKLMKFKTTSDYDFSHILIADYGLNLLQVAPLLPYYDIDPNIVQFMGTGVIDDKNFFLEPSLQGAIFPGVELKNRSHLIEQYAKIYDENFIRISTLPYDLIGLLNFVYQNQLSLGEMFDLLDNSNVKFDGIDGNFYFKNNMIERDLEILKISNGNANKLLN